MAIVRTRKISVYIPAAKISKAAELLYESGIFEPSGENRFMAEGIEKSIDEKMQKTEKALAILSEYIPKKRNILKKRPKKSRAELLGNREDERLSFRRINEILSLSGKISRIDGEISEAEQTIRTLLPYKNLDISPEEEHTEHTVSLAGTCAPHTRAELNVAAESACARIYFELLSSVNGEAYIWVLYLVRDSERAAEFLQNIGFKPSALAHIPRPPSEEILRLEQKCRRKRDERERLSKCLTTAAVYRQSLELYYDRLMQKRGKYLTLSSAENTASTVAVTGYVPENSADSVIDTLENRLVLAAETEETDEGEVLPVAFKNNAFSAPVEEITASYSMPSGGDIDPNPIMAIFYYWFFGMMFSDAGYGILMMAVCSVLGFSRLLDKDARKKYKMFFFCGVSTTLWGIAYGSFFGDLPAVISKTFFGESVTLSPLLLDPVNQALELLILSVIFGVIHIITALSIKFYMLIKRGDVKSAVYDVGFWITLLLGVCIFAAEIALGLSRNLGTGVIACSALGLVLTGGRQHKNPIKRIFSGVLSLYDITSYVGDVLSYSRLMALGLATGVIASVVNILASLGGNSPAGAVMFTAVALFGHGLNFAINMLGAYVHTNRLQYVEFYQKFYTGGGRRFNPIRPDTKYFDFTDN